MPDWWIWSSKNLVDWQHECIIDPKDTYAKGTKGCFAVDAAYKDGKYYLYFSEYTNSVGVLVSDTPVGQWKDPLGKPIVSNETIDWHRVYDPAVFIDEDGTPHLVFGHCRHYIARLNEDMISLAEEPHHIVENHDAGFCTGENCPSRLEDKPFLHKANGKYYLSIGAFYGMSDHVYGPYECQGAFIKAENFPDTHQFQQGEHDMTTDRHGSFFEYDGQWYFACNDLSQTQELYFRDFSIMKIDYDKAGKIIPPSLDPAGIRIEL